MVIMKRSCQFLHQHHIMIVVLAIFLAVRFRPVLGNSSGFNDVSVNCIERERKALLKFKDELVDEHGRLSSWGTAEDQEDCCRWKGVYCDNYTNHVVMLDLRGPSSEDGDNHLAPLRGKVSSSLLKLHNLVYLDLSFNDFGHTPIPEFLGSLSKLRYLNLSQTHFRGSVPHQLGNLSRLQHLDLSVKSFSLLKSTSLGWISRLHSLRHLDLSLVDLRMATDWAEALTNLPLLEELRMVWCDLPDIHPTSPFSTNSSAYLAVLDLRFNYLSSSSIYPWLFNFSNSLLFIELSENRLQGSIPEGFCNMISLSDLSISFNRLEGGVPSCFGNLTRLESLKVAGNNMSGQLPVLMMNLSGTAQNTLRYLDLSLNYFSGSLPDISEFFSLMEFRVSRNNLSGTLPEGYGQLANLLVLDMSGNQLTGALPDLALSSSLRELYLASNQFNGYLSESIGRLSHLEVLSLDSNHFEGDITESHFCNASQLKVLDLSYNSLLALKFKSDWIPPFQLNTFAVSHLQLGPYFPIWFRTQHNISKIDMSYTRISDILPSWFWDLSPSLAYLNLSNNKLYGFLPDLSSKTSWHLQMDLSSNNFYTPIPSLPPNLMTLNLSKNYFWGSVSFLCNISGSMRSLDLSSNRFSGQLPDCFTKFGLLVILNLANNDFLGKIPNSIGTLVSAEALHLQKNNFTGKIPTSMRNCRRLKILDLRENKMSGKLPPWLGDSFLNLVALILQSNQFNGTIPLNLCHLKQLQILDLSKNKIFGSVPNCINNLKAMGQEGSSKQTINIVHGDSSAFTWKGMPFEYRSTLGLVKVIDLSSNNLTGKIPPEITDLVGLVGLNLSRNNLTGYIPRNVGEISALNFIDLSRNQISGDIPTSLSQLNHLGILDLSYNNLSGRIPVSTQLEYFNDSSYIGNSGLCGLPLPIACPLPPTPPYPNIPIAKIDHLETEKEDTFITMEFFISMGLGFLFGNWGVLGTLALNRSLRYAFFKTLNSIGDWLYVSVAVNKARLQRKTEKWRQCFRN